MIEFAALFSALRVVRDAWAYHRSRQRTLKPAEVLQLRQKWKDEFEQRIFERRKQGLRADAIVRDVKRLDNYPDTDDKKKGVSSWFRVGLVGTYHKGVLLGLRWGTLTNDHDGAWRYTNHEKGERGDQKVLLVGYVPYERIEAVDWNGDEYYSYPHIYCYFTSKAKEPYERLIFCEQRDLDGTPHYSEVAEYRVVHARRKKAGVEYFG